MGGLSSRSNFPDMPAKPSQADVIRKIKETKPERGGLFSRPTTVLVPPDMKGLRKEQIDLLHHLRLPTVGTLALRWPERLAPVAHVSRGSPR